ncbi:MAG: hypothetical protein ACOYNP_05950 [Gemmataceae bacterium]|jgi:hypothetical protein
MKIVLNICKAGWQRLVFSPMLGIVIGILGCSGEPGPVRVSGSVVSEKDAGLGEVSVVFFPMDSKARTAMTMTLTDGTFSLDVFPGQYGLGFSRMRGGKTLQNFMSPASQQTQEYKDMVKEGKGGIPPKNTLPEKFIEAKTSGFEMTVQPRVQPAVQFKLPVAE